jgi:mono/diheme cytochrome c family protein
MNRFAHPSGSRRSSGRTTAGVLLALGSLISVIHAQAPATAPAVAAETIEKGRQHFVTYTCYACHGYGGHGSGSGPRIDTTRRTFEVFRKYVRQPGGNMPPFRTESQIPDSALEEIYAYLDSLPPPPDPKSIPLLMAE